MIIFGCVEQPYKKTSPKLIQQLEALNVYQLLENHLAEIMVNKIVGWSVLVLLYQHS